MEIKKKSEYIWEIPKTGKMKVPAFVYASKNLIEKIQQDKTLEQAQNVACLPGIQKASYTMPDAHQGLLDSLSTSPQMDSQSEELQHLIWKKELFRLAV